MANDQKQTREKVLTAVLDRLVLAKRPALTFTTNGQKQ